jgi:uncharacterized glyoxalase superfamily protein PhnB
VGLRVYSGAASAPSERYAQLILFDAKVTAPMRHDAPEEASPMEQRVFPQLRMMNWGRTRRFYVDGLGFTVDWEHRFEPDYPVFAQVTRDGLSLFLTEHTGDCEVGGAAYLVVDDVDALFGEIRTRGIAVQPPEDTPWGTREMGVKDPDGNSLRFANPAEH